MNQVCDIEKSNAEHLLNPKAKKEWINPSKKLVDSAMIRWKKSSTSKADNTSVVVIMLDPPGPPRAQVLRGDKEEPAKLQATPPSTPNRSPSLPPTPIFPHLQGSPSTRRAFEEASIISRFPNAANLPERNLIKSGPSDNRVLQSGAGNDLNRLSTSYKIIGQADSLSEAKEASVSTKSTVPLSSDNENTQGDEISSSSSSTPKLSSPFSTPKRKLNISSLPPTPKMYWSPTSKLYRIAASDTNCNTETETQGLLENKETVVKNDSNSKPKYAKVKKAPIFKSSMSLRPRPSRAVSTPPSKPVAVPKDRKRKQDSISSSVSTKSPRVMPMADTKPVMTRSRSARALRHKK